MRKISYFSKRNKLQILRELLGYIPKSPATWASRDRAACLI
jgi:hypothetical protein